jgi:hypothetical protein
VPIMTIPECTKSSIPTARKLLLILTVLLQQRFENSLKLITIQDDTGDPTQIWTYIRTGAGFEDDQKFMITMDGKALTWPELSMEDIDHSNPNQEWEIVIFPE